MKIVGVYLRERGVRPRKTETQVRISMARDGWNEPHRRNSGAGPHCQRPEGEGSSRAPRPEFVISGPPGTRFKTGRFNPGEQTWPVNDSIRPRKG